MLGRLYGLYKTVIESIAGYGELLWSDVVAQVATMQETVAMFQAQAKKLPKVGKDTRSGVADECVVQGCYEVGTLAMSWVQAKKLLR